MKKTAISRILLVLGVLGILGTSNTSAKAEYWGDKSLSGTPYRAMTTPDRAIEKVGSSITLDVPPSPQRTTFHAGNAGSGTFRVTTLPGIKVTLTDPTVEEDPVYGRVHPAVTVTDGAICSVTQPEFQVSVHGSSSPVEVLFEEVDGRVSEEFRQPLTLYGPLPTIWTGTLE